MSLALTLPLHGTALIEASAGTGKTYTLALLYVRLILGPAPDASETGEGAVLRACDPADILVITFTQAATEELHARIRTRLVQAADAFAGAADDEALAALVASWPEASHPGCSQRLRLAAQSLDLAAISTIHGWCQRMLREHAFASGSLFQQTVQTDEDVMRAEVVRDYWRIHCYPLAGDSLRWVETRWGDPDTLLRRLQGLLSRVTPSLPEATLAEVMRPVLAAAGAAQQARRSAMPGLCDRLEQFLREGQAAGLFNGRMIQTRYYEPWFRDLRAWAAGDQSWSSDLMAEGGWKRLSREGLIEALKQPDGELPSAVLDDLDQLQRWRAEPVPEPLREALTHAAGWVAATLDARKRSQGLLGYDDMLRRLDAALHGASGERLAELIRQQHPVALVDEFQDTDPVQYRVLDRIYRVGNGHPGTALLFIGDPKQAIYGFRGADIHTYLAARARTEGHHHVLDMNHRSATGLVTAVNHCFQRAESRPGPGAFRQRQDGQDPMPFHAVTAAGRPEVWEIEGQPGCPLTVWHRPSEAPLSRASLRDELAAATASEIVRLLTLATAGRAGFRQADGRLTPLRPADIALLVRDRNEAEALGQALSARGLRSVYLSDKDSLLASPEAEDVLRWLQACARPASDRLMRAALATPTLALSLAELDAVQRDERVREQHAQRFQDWLRIWRQQGVLPMLRQMLHAFALPERLLAETGGARTLTNLLHLAEWLQQASRELDGELALIRHLRQQREAGGKGDELVLRLESDADLVRIVTIHKSKGLEYPLVFLPFVCGFREQAYKPGQLLHWHDGRQWRWSPAPTAADEQLADRGRLDEDLRLLYVALTRARHACWLVMHDVSVGNSKASRLQDSAPGWLLLGDEPLADSADLQRRLQDWVVPGASALVTLPAVSMAAWQAPVVASPDYRCRIARARPVTPWWIASYSAIRYQHDDGPRPAAPTRPQAQHLGDDDRAALLDLAPVTPTGWHAFPRGPNEGNFLHDLLEWAAGQGFARVLADPALRRQELVLRCDAAGHPDWMPLLDDWLCALLSRPLSDASLPALSGLDRVRAELEFMLPSAHVAWTRLDALARQHVLPGHPRPAVQPGAFQGMLKGFMDLVIAHEGRYFVLDYKSNWLGPDDAAYTPEAMHAAMLTHRYDLQLLLYLLALHRQLQARLPDYDCDRHLGGAVYFFLRGVRADTAGAWFLRPPSEVIAALDACFRGDVAEVPA